MSDIFMSYVEEDSSVATQIGDGLQAAGYSTWLYERDSLPGIAYLLQTGEAITLSQAFVLIISPDSVVSNQVTAEVVRAHENNVPFFPLLHGITHLEFQESQPLWRQAIGAATSIAIDEGNIPALAERIVRALEAMGIQPSQAPKPVAETLEAPQPTAAKPSRNLPVQQTSFTGRESQIQEISDNSHLIDPLVSLTFALHSNPGAYAVLVGSGVSVGAGIPTGWQVVLDLISKVARVLGEDPGDDVARWYQERFGEEPDYGKLLDTLAKSPAERSALLRGYFEPTAEERARGVKVPGAAHKALAELAVIGHVQIFVTTNFDRLIEQALEAAGINPRVLSTPDSILGSPPLSQAGCTVLKLHGDYLDTRIKNTSLELDAYDESVDALLDQIIDEHGFIVCGWSATWDTALCRAFERSKNRRYTTYWADVVTPGKQASHLIELLHGEFVQVKGADAFFTDMVEKLKSLGDGDGETTYVAESPRPTAYVPLASGFVGRHVEMGELTSALDDAFAGRGRMVMLVGEPGIGKTRCAQELAAIAEAQGAQVVWGRCHESEGAPPYWIWTQAIRSYMQDKDGAQLRSVMGVGASCIADMIPEVKQVLPDLEPSPQSDSPEQARFRLFDSVTTFLKNASQSQPLVIVLDDLQWADRSSLMLLEFMVTEMGTSRLLVVGTYRDVDISREHQLSQTLGMLTKEQLFTRVNCSGLSQDEVGDYVKTASSVSLVSGLAEAVHGRTNGNPLFVGEVVRLLEQEGIDDNRSWATAIPEGVIPNRYDHAAIGSGCGS